MAALEHSGHSRITVRVSQSVGHVEPGAEVSGVRIERMGSRGAPPEAALAAVVRRPLGALADEGRVRPLIFLIDAIDEARITNPAGHTIAGGGSRESTNGDPHDRHIATRAGISPPAPPRRRSGALA